MYKCKYLKIYYKCFIQIGPNILIMTSLYIGGITVQLFLHSKTPSKWGEFTNENGTQI